MLVRVELTGVSPLMFNKMTDEATEQLTTKGRSSMRSPTSGGLTPRDEAAKRLHLNHEGVPVVPMIMVHSALVAAGKFHRWGKKQLTTAASTIVPAFLTILDTEAVIQSEGEWEVDSRPAHNQNAAGYVAVISHRPRFFYWTIEFDMEIEEKDGDPRLVRDLLDTAGKKIGLGSYRVSQGGPYGKYVVTRWEKIIQDRDVIEDVTHHPVRPAPQPAPMELRPIRLSDDGTPIYDVVEEPEELEEEPEQPKKKRGRPPKKNPNGGGVWSDQAMRVK